MILSLLFVIRHFLELAKRYQLKKNSLDTDLFRSSTLTSESMVIFKNCDGLQVSEITNGIKLKGSKCKSNCHCLKRQKILRRKKHRLNAIKKMDYDEEGCKDILNGIIAGFKGNLVSPVSDCNSNNLTIPKENMLLCSIDSIQDCPDFVQDNSDYQWFLDYGYKYNNSYHQSILSMSRSQDLIFYDDMAKNIDANLAEVDMEHFNREDIHSVLSSLPNMQGVEEREMFASVTGSLMVKFDFDSCVSPRSNSQEEQINTSICKSQLLFSPVRESYLPNTNLSVDSLDLSENDINLMVTCQSNKNNYTIAFEGSTVMTSDESESRDTFTSGSYRSEENKNIQVEVQLQPPGGSGSERSRSSSQNAMVTSDLTLTTWSKIKEIPNENLHVKHDSSENNYTTTNFSSSSKYISSSIFKSISLPNLFQPKQNQNTGMSLSVKLNSELKRKNSLNSQCVRLYDIQANSKNMDQSMLSASKNPVHNFSLVKLFIKQKSASREGMSNYSTEQNTQNDMCKTSKNCESVEKNWAGSKIVNNCYVNNVENTSIGHKTHIKEGEIKKTIIDSKPAKQTSSSENFVSKTILSDYNKTQTKNIGYYSDESTQGNGSNTESTEHLTCNCNNSPVVEKKKVVTEKSIQTSGILDMKDNQKKPVKVPVYILYPNYSLPNLEFLKREHYVQNIDFSKVFLKPQKFQVPESPVETPKKCGKPCGRRPFSVNDIETLKKTGFKHVKDWESLTFLLPKEYKQFLQEIPEIVAQLKGVRNSKEELVPLFCLSPPPNRKVRKRPYSCDVNISNDGRSSNFSSTATQPSSGYRGSSTMLNSNNSYINSPRNPSFSYKYDTNSESGYSRRSGSLSHNRNCSVNSDDSNENYIHRPPLPKSILRNNSLDNHQYTCKTQKEYANKRYSMVELTDKNVVLEEKYNKRRSLHHSNSKSHQISANKNTEQKQSLNAAQSVSNKSNLEKDLKRLEELLEISAVFGESIESFTETDMMKLRSQVSKFLTMQKNLEKVSETLQTGIGEKEVNESNRNKSVHTFEENHSAAVKNLQTPHNTPEHKKQPNNNRNMDVNTFLTEDYLKPCSCNGVVHEFEGEDCNFRDESLGGLRKTVSFAEKISFATKEHELTNKKPFSDCSVADQKNQIKAKRPVDLPICEESSEVVSVRSPTVNFSQNSSDLIHKRDLILDVGSAVKKIFKLCKETTEDPANICLHHLCPSLYAVLSDGLKEEIATPFGPIRNSVWSVIEASSQQGLMTQTLNELVQRLNREDIFTEGLIKFNAFIFGLLNAQALSGWFSYLRTRDSLLRKYYDSSGLLLLSNTAGAPVRLLVDQLITIIEPLGSLQFNLDLMYQTKLLHCSLQNLNCLLEEPSNNDFLTPTKQFMLLKLVQSIQNSLSQSGEARKGRHILEEIEQKTSDPSVDHLLEKNKNVRARRGGSKNRPRSGCDSVAAGTEVTDVASAMKKRWSGINLNSKLTEAFDRLVDESDSEYTDSLDVTAPREVEGEVTSPVKNVQKEENSKISATISGADMSTKEQKKNILLNLNRKSSGKTQGSKLEPELKGAEKSSTSVQNGDQKFKRLQQKWERWERSGRSSSDSDSDGKSPSKEEKTPSHMNRNALNKSHKSENVNCDTNIIIPTSRTSKIPRLVTSPSSSTPNTKLAGNVQRLVSPTYSNNPNQQSGKINYSNTSRGNSLEGRKSSFGGSRFSRFDEKVETVLKAESGKNRTAVLTNASHKRSSTAPAKKSEPVARKNVSMSLNRKSVGKKLHQAQRTVRTLTHRLPSDSGHLSFNEGERLKVVLEVDKAWLLCCRGSQKGLVPKSLVISDNDDKF